MDDPTRHRRAERQELLAALAPPVQHAVNNFLTVLSGTADILRRTAKDEAGAARAGRLAEAAQRIEAVTRAYLTLARRPVPEDAGAELGVTLARLLPLIEIHLPRGVTVNLSVAPDLPRLAMDASVLDGPLMALLWAAGPEIATRLGLTLTRGEGGLLLRIEGLPTEADTAPLERAVTAGGGRVAQRGVVLELALPAEG